MKKISFPFEVTKGSVSVKIYRTPTRGCESFTLAYWQDDTRKRKTFPTFEKASAEADAVVGRMSSTDANIFTLTCADGAAYQRARYLLDPVGVSIEMAAAEVASARRKLGDVPISQAVDYYLKRHPINIGTYPVKDVIAEMLKAKRSDGLSEGYLKHLRYDLEKFARAFHVNIGVITGAEIDTWLRGLGVSPRTRNNLRNSVQTLFGYAKARMYLPKDHDELDAVSRAKDRDGEIEVFTPSEMAEILNHADKALIPFLTLGAFAGIRHAEIQRLDWKDLYLDERFIEIRAKKSKTASRRTIPIVDNLLVWLQSHQQPSGPVCKYQNMASEIGELTRTINKDRRSKWALANNVSDDELKKAEKRSRQRLRKLKEQSTRRQHKGEVPPGAETAGEEGWPAFTWKHNALRHSFISYRVAEIQNVAQVALEAGNSPQMIFQHYRELVRPKEAKAWFAIGPK